MKPKGTWGLRGAIVMAGLVLSLGAAPFLHADDEDQNAPQGRAVRLSSVDGPVQVVQGGQLLTDQAVANMPLFEGTQLSTGNDGRAEIQFEDGSVTRVPPQSEMTLSVLQPDGKTEILLGGGMAYFELQGANQDNPIRVRFGSYIVTASGFTVLRVKLDEGPAAVAVFSGNAHIEGPGGAADVHGGESLALNSANPGDSSVAESIEPDSWDAWNSDRDQALTASESAPGNPDIPQTQSSNPAWGDLNQNGTWYNVPGQGEIWSPYEASNPGFDPFGEGYWVWTPGYGYMWVSTYSWGYLPYQCGIWNWYDGFGWGWSPGNFNPWWGGYGGGGGWIFTAATLPTWYKLPVRPGPPKPRDPHWNVRARPGSQQPLVAVHRTMPIQGIPTQGALPPRDRTIPVTIGGVAAAPVLTQPVRTIYNHQPAPGQRSPGQPSPGQPSPGQSGRTVIAAPPERPLSPDRPVYGRTPQAAPERPNWPSARPAETGRPAPPPPAPRASPPPAPSRPSYGGGGGGHSSPPPPPSHSSPPPAPSHPK